MLQCCVRLSSVTLGYLPWLNGVSYRAKVSTDNLQEVVYKKSIGTKMNDLDLCL